MWPLSRDVVGSRKDASIVLKNELLVSKRSAKVCVFWVFLMLGESCCVSHNR